MHTTVKYLLLLRVVASWRSSCVDGPGWTPSKAASTSRAQSPRASENPALDKFYIYDERDGYYSFEWIRAVLGQAARKSGTQTWRDYVDAVGSGVQHQGVIFLLDALLDHPARTMNAAEAKWLIAPIGIDPKTPAYLLATNSAGASSTRARHPATGDRSRPWKPGHGGLQTSTRKSFRRTRRVALTRTRRSPRVRRTRRSPRVVPRTRTWTRTPARPPHWPRRTCWC